MGDVVSMSVPEKVVANIVQAEVSTRVAEALKGNDEIVRKIVDAALKLKVDDRGQPCSYSSARPYIEHIAVQAIRDAANDAMKDYVQGNKEKIKKEVEKQLKASTNKLVQAFMDAVVEQATSCYRFNVNVNVESHK